MEQIKKPRKKRTLSSFSETEAQLLERLKKMKEEKKKYISNMLGTIFNEILNDDKLLEILDENKDNKDFQENLSLVLTTEIEKYTTKEHKEQVINE